MSNSYKKKNKGLSNDLPIPLEATKNHMITFPCLLLILGQHHTWSRGDYNARRDNGACHWISHLHCEYYLVAEPENLFRMDQAKYI